LTSQPIVRGSDSPGRISELVSSASPSASSSAWSKTWSGIRTPTVRLRGWSSRRVVDVHELAELGEVAAHQREVVPLVEAADLQDPVAPLAVADATAERVTRVRGVGDQRVVLTERGDHLLEQPRLRVLGVDVDEASHDMQV
jgi:hypothetical protein